jgi:hypothetical protein
MPHFSRHFTVVEARALLPELRRTFARIHRLLDEIQRERGERQEERGSAAATPGEDDAAGVQFFSANGHGPRVTGGDRGARVAEIQKLVGDLHEQGVLVKDLRRGLCDFPHFLPGSGDEVFLCWELSEPDIRYWHTVEGGFAAREPLDE